MFVIKFYSKKWKSNAFYTGEKVRQFPRYAKKVAGAKRYTLEHNAVKVANQLSKITGTIHSYARKW
jgi:hypothetical protein